MAVIWRVSRPDVAMPLVMKVPKLRYGEDPASIVAYEVERLVLPRLTGHHVPRFVEAGDFDRPYIVMELVHGRSLVTRLDETPLPPAEVAELGAAIAEALADVHAQAVIHHDVKPSNVIVREDGTVVLIDFGFARHAALPDLIATEFRGPVGTGAYISPEQLSGRRDEPRSDLFALGVILYFLGTGERPFGDPLRQRDWRRRLWRDPVPPRRRQPACPPWLQEIILRLLEVEPAERHSSAAALAAELREPVRVCLTARASRQGRDGAWTVLRRRLHANERAAPAPTPAAAPLVMAALDVAPDNQRLALELRDAVRRVLANEPGARLACVNVFKTSRLANDELEDAEGRTVQLRRLDELMRWARPLGLPPERATGHVLESPDIAAALLDFARANGVGHIIMGARSSSALRRYLGSVSARVVAEAPCTVTVVRGESRT
jgi:serine/threonine protein kinase